MACFKIGDTIVAMGSTISKEGVVEKHRALAEVIHVGRYDLFVKDISSSSYSRNIFIISKKSCAKVGDLQVELTQQPVKPKLGDLVLAYNGSMGKQETKTGILTEIINKPGVHCQAKILQGAKTQIVSFDNLIVLEH